MFDGSSDPSTDGSAVGAGAGPILLEGGRQHSEDVEAGRATLNRDYRAPRGQVRHCATQIGDPSSAPTTTRCTVKPGPTST